MKDYKTSATLMELITRLTTDNLEIIPSEVAGLLILHVNAKSLFTTTRRFTWHTLRVPQHPFTPQTHSRKQPLNQLNVLKSYVFTNFCKLGVKSSVSERAIKYYLKVSHDSRGSSVFFLPLQKLKPPNGDNNVVQKFNTERKNRRSPQDDILCYRTRAAIDYVQSLFFL